MEGSIAIAQHDTGRTAGYDVGLAVTVEVGIGAAYWTCTVKGLKD